MAIKYVMPKLAMAMNEGSVNEWLIKQGEKVAKGDALVTIETEKVTYDCESPEEGYLCIVTQAGNTVPCEELIGYFCESAEKAAEMLASAASTPTAAEENPATPAEASVPSAAPAISAPVLAASIANGGRIIASPLAKKLAKDAGLDLSVVTGTGPNNRIVKKDVEAALTAGVHRAPVLSAQGGSSELARIPMKGMRKVIADRMKQSLTTTAQLSSAWESDITDLLAIRKKFVAREDALGTKVSMNAFIIKAIVYAIKQVPIANACSDGEEAVIYSNINMGIAISMPGTTEYDSGLMVAVLHNVENMGVVEIDKEMKALIGRIRNGESTPQDTTGSTITMSTTAGIAPPGMSTTPVLNLPNAALVGPSTAIKKPVVKEGEIVVRTMMPMSFTFDHCILDGEPAARFMSALHDALENPELMMS
ncbi:MAG: dihydrolipoamide acetyltransferase family protein [Colwellia sp.]|jgi:Pyruvate/2-oxoglutarate dehydrogenase complex, dihydrolipoamide acyltransferase (E2) component, and related enzymes